MTVYTYDANNRVTGVLKPNGSETNNACDDKKRLISTFDRTPYLGIISGFEYTYDDMSRVVEEKVLAKSPAELMAEGEALHHCVGAMGYDQKFVREETLIFFIRNANEPNVPLATVEYSLKTKKVLQCYADHNQKPSQEIEDYVRKKWLPHANRALKKLAA